VLGAGGQDALDRLVRGVAGLQRPAASSRASPCFWPSRSTPWAWRSRNRASTDSSSPVSASQAGPTSAAWDRHHAGVRMKNPALCSGRSAQSVRRPRGWNGCVLTSWASRKNSTTAPVARASSRWPISLYGSEYKVRPTFAWASGATLGRLQLASSNPAAGSGSSAGASSAANTPAGVRPSSARGRRWPATCAHQRAASAAIASRLGQSRPAKKLDRMYRCSDSMAGLSVG
jgi:hypothetical protein